MKINRRFGELRMFDTSRCNAETRSTQRRHLCGCIFTHRRVRDLPLKWQARWVGFMTHFLGINFVRGDGRVGGGWSGE
jgi:hypothetical protein